MNHYQKLSELYEKLLTQYNKNRTDFLYSALLLLAEDLRKRYKYISDKDINAAVAQGSIVPPPPGNPPPPY